MSLCVFCNKEINGSALLCSLCKNFVHFECCKVASLIDTKSDSMPHSEGVTYIFPNDCNYTFTCAKCGEEKISLNKKEWHEIIELVLLQLISQNDSSTFFTIEQIASVIEKFSDSLILAEQRPTNINEECLNTLTNFKDIFISNDNKWTLKDKDSVISKLQSYLLVKKENVSTESKTLKRARNENETSIDKKSKTIIKEASRMRKIVLSIYFYRLILLLIKLEPEFYSFPDMRMVKENSAPQIHISEDGLFVSHDLGYMMARASYGAHEGTYYYEVEIPKHKGNLRIGFATEKADQQAPVGYDCYGYSIRDKDGMIFHQSREPGDVLGCLIRLPKIDRTLLAREDPDGTSGLCTVTPPMSPERDSSGNEIVNYNEETRIASFHFIEGEARLKWREEQQKNPKCSRTEKPSLPPGAEASGTKPPQEKEEGFWEHKDSQIEFFINGESLGVAFSGIYTGTYYPAVSLYYGGAAKLNFGPNFKYPVSDAKPFTELAKEKWSKIESSRKVLAQRKTILDNYLNKLFEEVKVENTVKDENSVQTENSVKDENSVQTENTVKVEDKK